MTGLAGAGLGPAGVDRVSIQSLTWPSRPARTRWRCASPASLPKETHHALFLCVRIGGPCDFAAVVSGLGRHGARPGLGLLGHDSSPPSRPSSRAGSGKCCSIWLAGGASQLETWDPKPGTDTGGPFRSIETSVPGVRISELMPLTAKQMHRMALVRGVNTKEDDHGKG